MGPGVCAASSVHWHKEPLWAETACSSVSSTCRLQGCVVPRPADLITCCRTQPPGLSHYVKVTRF